MTASVKLDRESSQEVLDRSIRTQAQLVLESPAFEGTTVNGYLISGDETALLMEMTGQPSISVNRLLNVRCEIRLYSDRCYGFSAIIQAVPTWGSSRCLALSRPTTVGLLERRRFLRARLAASTRVLIEWLADGVNHRHTATMLNVSPEGLACRVDSSVACVMEQGSRVRMQFSLPPRTEVLRFQAQVCNKTPASEGHTILGLHFEPRSEDADAFAALREILDVPRPVAAPAATEALA